MEVDGWCTVPPEAGQNALNDAGKAMYASFLAATEPGPAYQLRAEIDPVSGLVDASLRATLADGASDEAPQFRVFAGLDDFNAGLVIENVRVDGEPSDVTLDQALLSVANAGTTIEMDFAYTLQESAANEGDLLGALSGESLQPSDVGLLGRTESGAQLGHWFPVWLPPDVRADADPAGFGDIGAFRASEICAELRVPDGYELITGGSLLGETETGVIEGGLGLRDLGILISNELAMREGDVDGVAVRVWGPADDDVALRTVLDHALISQRSLADAFGPYPWDEIDVVSAPLGSGVGGMEWPGMVWIERSMFAGGIAGIGDLGLPEVGGNDIFNDLLGDLFSDIGGPAVATSLEWTVAHELGHEWWHAVVGNDSIASPAIDEPLAQFSACIAMQDIHPGTWREICEAQTIDTFAQTRALGIEDTAAEQASDAFDSSLQYGAVVYGKAPGFYFETADLIGWDTLTDALASFVAEHPFELVSSDVLRQHLIDAAGDDGDAVGELWDRWLRDAKGDEDIPVVPGAGFGDLGDFEGLGDLEGLDELGDIEDLSDLFGEGGLGDLFSEDDLDELFGEGDLDDLLEQFFGDATTSA